MKIAIDVHSIGSGAGGNETFYRQLVAGLISENGDHQFFLFYTHPAAPKAFANDERVTWIQIPRDPFFRNVLSLPRWLQKLRPDVFHCQYVKPPFVRCPTVVTIHDIGHEHLPEHFHPLYVARQRRLVRATARKADHILTVSEFAARDIATTYGIGRQKITVAYQAPASIFRPYDKQAAQRELAARCKINVPFLLYVGRLNSRKNLLRLVQAYAAARTHGVTAALVLAGPRDWRSGQVLACITELGLESHVVLPGYIAPDDLPLFLSACEAFVYPSLFEGFGLPVVEAIACGAPVITSRGSALEEVAGDAALIVDPLDTRSIADAIERMLHDPALRTELAQRGLRRCAHFLPEELPRKTLTAYELAIVAARANSSQ